MKRKTYEEIRANCTLLEYAEYFTGKKSLWCESYKDEFGNYMAYFEPDNTDPQPQLLQYVPNDPT